MGQKINPYGFRLGVTTDWKSRWFASREDYANFLQAILADDTRSPTALPPAISSFLDEDDADFDYLTAVAQTKEDPLEYRNDKAVHVSRREIVDLVGGHPARRRRLRRSGITATGVREARRKVAAPCPPTASGPVAPAGSTASYLVATPLPPTAAPNHTPIAVPSQSVALEANPSSVSQAPFHGQVMGTSASAQLPSTVTTPQFPAL